MSSSWLEFIYWVVICFVGFEAARYAAPACGIKIASAYEERVSSQLQRIIVCRYCDQVKFVTNKVVCCYLATRVVSTVRYSRFWPSSWRINLQAGEKRSIKWKYRRQLRRGRGGDIENPQEKIPIHVVYVRIASLFSRESRRGKSGELLKRASVCHDRGLIQPRPRDRSVSLNVEIHTGCGRNYQKR